MTGLGWGGEDKRLGAESRGRLLAVEVVGLHVGEDGWREALQVGVGGWGVAEEGVAEGGGAGGVGEALEEVDAGALGGAGGEDVEHEVDAGGVEAGATDDDPVGEREQVLWRAPLRELEEGIGADEDEEGVVGLEGGAEAFEGVDGVVRGVVGQGRFEVGGEAVQGGWSLGAEELNHGEAVGIGGDGAVGLERLMAGGDEEDAVEREGLRCGAGDGEMAAVGRVEAAAEVADTHRLILPRRRGLGCRSGAGSDWADTVVSTGVRGHEADGGLP
jgi:hypothetical protein